MLFYNNYKKKKKHNIYIFFKKEVYTYNKPVYNKTLLSLNSTHLQQNIIPMSVLFEGIFEIKDIDTGKYRNVSRIEATSVKEDGSSEQEPLTLALDVNTELFPLATGTNITLALASSLNETEESNKNTVTSWRPPRAGEYSLADSYDYVMHGVAYKFEEVASNKNRIAVFYSFGGLLLRLEGNHRDLSNLKQENAYILLRH